MKKPLISVIGPTATGKSDLAVYIAEKVNGEIISADSRQVYRHLDIGSGKIKPEETHGIKHYLLDIEDVDNEYTVSHFKKDANIAIKEILNKDKVPIICGGTGFWVDTVTRGLIIPEVPPNPKLREELEDKSAEELFQILTEKDIRRSLEIDRHNPYRLIRAIEIAEALGKVPEKTWEDSEYDLCTIGITDEKETINERIMKRLDSRLSEGMLDEVKEILEKGTKPERLISLGLEYRHLTLYLTGKYESIEDMKKNLYFDIIHFAKRQMTWFKRHKDIKWIKVGEKDKAIEILKEHFGNNIIK